jgi:hypothetical protein
MKFYNDSMIWSARLFLFQKQKEFKIASHLSGHQNIGRRHDNLDTTDSDSVVCSWPWQWFALEEADNPLLVTSHRWFLDESSFGWSAIAFCARKIMQIYTVHYLVRNVHKFDFRFVINNTTNKWRTVEKKLCCDRGIKFRQNPFLFSDHLREY